MNNTTPTSHALTNKPRAMWVLGTLCVCLLALVLAVALSPSQTAYADDSSNNSDSSTNITLTLTEVTQPNGKVLELRSKATMNVDTYDTLQGCCSDGTYLYYVLDDRQTKNCRIVKMRLKDCKIEGTSNVLDVGHGNDITYNPDNKTLVVTDHSVYPMRMSVINPDKLTITKSVNVQVPRKLDGASSNQLKKIKSFSACDYNAKHDCYVALLGTSHNFLMLDKDFKPVSYLEPEKSLDQKVQGMVAMDNYLLVCQAKKTGGQSNNIMVYSWDGKFIKCLTVPSSYELEDAFFAGKTFYLGFYHSSLGLYTDITTDTDTIMGKQRTINDSVVEFGINRNNYLYTATTK